MVARAPSAKTYLRKSLIAPFSLGSAEQDDRAFKVEGSF